VPLVGVKLLMAGASTVKLVALVAVPLGVVTLMGPVLAPAGTLTVSWVSELTTKPGASAPLKRTAVVPVKLTPVIVTGTLCPPLVGEKLLMAGDNTVKLVLLVPVPLGVVTVMGPLVAPVGTFTVSWVSELTVKPAAAVLLKRTADACKKLVPVITTLAPTSPLAGEKLLMTGGARTKLLVLVPVPLGVVTVMGPLVAPVGTFTVSWVSELTVKPAAAVPLKRTAVAPVK
jgi:hypothetical protein